MSNDRLPHWMPAELLKERPDNSMVRKQILDAYQTATGLHLSQPPTLSELELVAGWINANYASFSLLFNKAHPTIKTVYSTSLSSKAFLLAQHHCPICTTHEDSFPARVFSIRIPPVSKQAAAKKKGRREAFERAIKHRFADNSTPFPEHISICLLIVFVVKATGAQKDLDNMAKALLDAVKNVLFGDDRKIDHLNILRIKSPGEEFVCLNIRETRLNDHDDVLSPQMLHSWAGTKPLNLDDFMEDL